MPNKSIYVRDEDIPLFQKAQELAGESLSNVIAEAIRQYVHKRDMESQDMKEIVIWKGVKEIHYDSIDVEKFKFIGRFITDDMIDETANNGNIENLYLYQTVKGKFLLWQHITDGTQYRYDFRTYEDAKDLYSNVITAKMIDELEKKVGKSHITFLDI